MNLLPAYRNYIIAYSAHCQLVLVSKPYYIHLSNPVLSNLILKDLCLDSSKHPRNDSLFKNVIPYPRNYRQVYDRKGNCEQI